MKETEVTTEAAVPERIWIHAPELELFNREPCDCGHDVEFVRADSRPSAPAPEWQPIETAPKDGRDVLLSEGRTVWVDEWIINGPDSCWMMCDQWEEPATPTHWTPLPAPPESSPAAPSAVAHEDQDSDPG